MAEQSFYIKNIDELHAWTKSWWPKVHKPTLILLDGPMGSGKTKLVESLLHNMGGVGVSSPTFTFHQEYNTSEDTVHHFDLYRCENEDDIESTGLWDIVATAQGVLLIEWANKLSKASWPHPWHVYRIKLEVLGANERNLILETV